MSQEDQLKPTNPIAQKAALFAQHQYKVSPTATSRIKPKPLTFTSDKVSRFSRFLFYILLSCVVS